MRLPVQVLIATALVLVGGWLGYQWLFASDARQVLTVVSTQGEVRRGGGQGQGALEAGAELSASDTITVGEGGSAVLGLGELTRMSLEASSAIRVLEVSDQGVRIELEGGRVSARVRPGGASIGVSNQGRAVIAQDGAFRAAVGPDGTFAVGVDEGSVNVAGMGALSALGSGQQVTAPLGAEPAVSAVSAELLLEVAWPGAVAPTQPDATVSGKTQPYAELRATTGGGATTRARAGPDGAFELKLPVTQGSNAVSIEARDLLGQTSQVNGDVERAAPPPPTRAEVVWGP